MESPLDIRMHPLDLGEHGKTPSGLPLYRIVWADSRKSRLLHDGKMHTFGRYDEQPKTQGKWILEKWLPPEKYVGMTREQYEAYFAGPMFGAPKEEYPADGEYELVHIFEGSVDEPKVRSLVSLIEWRLRNVSLADRKAEVVQEYADTRAAKKAAKREVLEDIMGSEAQKEKTGVVYVH